MPRAKPPVERTCLVCDSTFTGTPAATRCDPCKGAGRKVPRDRQAQQRRSPEKKRQPKPDKPQHLKVCNSCGGEFSTHKAKAARCDLCLEENVPTRSEYTYVEKTIEELELEREAGRKAKRKERALAQLAQLNALSKIPQGYPKMKNTTAKSALGVLWLGLCHSDGQPNVLLSDREVDDATKALMMTTYLRLRLKGYTTEAISKICPVTLMSRTEADLDAGLRDLPKVTEQANDDHCQGFDPLEGLSEELRAEVIDFRARQEHREMAQRLHLPI